MKRWYWLLLLIMAWPAQAGMMLKLATSVPDGTSWMKALRQAGKEIEQQTEGRVRLKFYPGGVMGTDATVMRKMRVGQVHGAAFTGGELSVVTNDAQFYITPFMLRNHEEVKLVRQVLDGQIRQSIERKGLVVLGMSGGGFAHLMSARPGIHSLDAMRQRKLWVPMGDELNIRFLRELGISPVALSLADVYTGLQTGLVDTVATTASGALAFQWFTRLKAMLDVPLGYVMGYLVVDQRFFRRITPADQAIVRQVMDRTFSELDQLDTEENRRAMTTLEQRGIRREPMDETELRQLQEEVDAVVEKLVAEGLISATLYRQAQQILKASRGGQH